MSTRNPSRSRPDSCRSGAGFLAEESGAYTIFAVIGFAMLMVFVGLVIDTGRVMNIHSQASSYADRVALAAATELDGRPGALNRALAAARAVPDGDRLTLSGNDRAVGFERLVFMSRLGSDPNNPDTRTPKSGDVVTRRWSDDDGFNGGVGRTRADSESRYLMVETTRETENYLFFAMVGRLAPGMEGATVAPQAVAAHQRQMCNTAPLMICNPAERNQRGAVFRSAVGEQIALNLQGGIQGGFNWNYNNYSLLRVDSTALGIPLNISLRNLIGRPNPGTACYREDIRPRSVLGLRSDLNIQTPVGGLATEMGSGFNDLRSADRAIPVAVVNCREHRTRLQASALGLNVDVPIEAYAHVKVVDPVGASVAIRLRFVEKPEPTPGGTPDPLREFPVLVR